MRTISRLELKNIPDEELFRLTKNQAITFHMIDGKMTQARIKDFLITSNNQGSFITMIGYHICRTDVDFIEIYEDNDCPKVVL